MERLIKPSIKLGAIYGVLFGLLLLIPYIAPIIVFPMFILSGAAVIIFLKRLNSVGILSIYDGCMIGAIAGFFSSMAAMLVFLPIKSVFGGFFHLGLSLGLQAALWLIFPIGLLGALVNAFSGLVAAYVYERLETPHIEFKDHFEIEQDDMDI